MFICKSVQGLCYCLCLLASVFEVYVVIPVYLQLVWWFVLGDIYVRRISEVSKIRCRTIIFKVLLVSYFIAVFFVYNENINYWI